MFFDELLENPVESTAQITCVRMAATGALRSVAAMPSKVG